MKCTGRAGLRKSNFVLPGIAAIIACNFAFSVAESPASQQGAGAGGLEVVRHQRLGLPILVRTAGGGAIPMPAGAQGTSAADFFAAHGQVFGITDAAVQLVEAASEVDAFGWRHTTFHQRHQGIPVFSGMLKVHQNPAGDIISVNGRYYPIPEKLSAAPTLSAAEIEAKLRASLDAPYQAAATERNELVVVDPAWYGDPAMGATLAYHVVLRDDALGYREGFFIDAGDGEILDRWNMIAHALDRQVYDASGGGLPGILVRAEGDPPVDAEVDRAYDYCADTYNYFLRGHGRDGFNGAGATMIASVRRTFSCPNASWNGIQTSFCDGIATDDVVAHEFTHAVTQFSANLIYQNQSGQLNESFSDVFGEMVDMFNGDVAFPGPPSGTPWSPAPPSGTGLDTPNNLRTGMCSPALDYPDGVRWLVGEDALPFGGAIRDMWQPPCGNDPDRANSELQLCNPADAGGVHSGSGVPNHAFAMLTDGKTFNNQSVTGIGPIKAGAVWYRGLTQYLTPASDFEDAYAGLNQAAQDLVGLDPNDPRTGMPSGSPITAFDAQQVDLALIAVEMNTSGACGAGDDVVDDDAPVTCDSPVTIYFDDFESGANGWTVSNSGPLTPYDWVQSASLPFARPGTAWFCADPSFGNCANLDESGVHSLFSPVIAGVNPQGGAVFASFAHYMSSEGSWDAGNLKISIDGGPWQVINRELYSFNPPNTRINSVVQGNTNPLGGQQGWSGSGGRFGTSVVDLRSLVSAGDDVQFRFDFGKDGCTGVDGWYVDDFHVFACPDCDGNAQIDIDAYYFARASQFLGNIGDASPQSFLISAPPAAVGDVIVAFTARGDFSDASEFVDVDVNGTAIGQVYALGASDCGNNPEVHELVVPAATWNTALAGGDATINLLAAPNVNATVGLNCFGETYISVFVRYDTTPNDCNDNRSPDGCEAIDAGIPAFVSDMLDGGVYACYFDFNDDGELDGEDVQPYVDALLAP